MYGRWPSCGVLPNTGGESPPRIYRLCRASRHDRIDIFANLLLNLLTEPQISSSGFPDEFTPPPLHPQYDALRGTYTFSPPGDASSFAYLLPSLTAAAASPSAVATSAAIPDGPGRYRARSGWTCWSSAYLCCKPAAANLFSVVSCRLAPCCDHIFTAVKLRAHYPELFFRGINDREVTHTVVRLDKNPL